MKVRRLLLALVLGLALLQGFAPAPATAQAPMTWAVHVTLAPTWFDPGEHSGIITLMMVLYAIHDAMVKPMPGNAMTPSLAESWTVAKDGLSYEFALRKGVVFHNDPLPGTSSSLSATGRGGLLQGRWRGRDRRSTGPLPPEGPDFRPSTAPATGAGGRAHTEG
jgi:peptide/nickel transport system substrate-binding protein